MTMFKFINIYGSEFITTANRYSVAYYEFKASNEYINQKFKCYRNNELLIDNT